MSDNIDSILAGYDKPATIAPDAAQPAPGTSSPGSLDQILPTAGSPAPPKGISITHNAAVANQPAPQYYVRGPKKGQLKPVKAQSKSAPAPTGATPTAIPASTLMTGAMFISMVDMFLPMIIVALHNWQFPDMKIKVEDMKMKDYQKNDLAPIADNLARQLNINAPPGVLILVSFVGIYGINVMTVHNEAALKKKLDAKKAKESADKAAAKDSAANVHGTFNPAMHRTTYE